MIISTMRKSRMTKSRMTTILGYTGGNTLEKAFTNDMLSVIATKVGLLTPATITPKMRIKIISIIKACSHPAHSPLLTHMAATGPL